MAHTRHAGFPAVMANIRKHPVPVRNVNEAFVVSSDGAQGLSRSQTRGSSFSQPSRGVRYAAGATDVDLARTTATLLGSREEATLTDLSAADLRDLPLPPRGAWKVSEPRLSIATSPGGSHPQRRGVRGRRLDLPEEHLVWYRGIRCTSVARTWVDCAAEISLPHLVAMGDAALRRQLVTLAELDAVVRWARGRRGVVAARTALPLLDPAAESPPESIVRAILVLAKLPRPACNVDISHAGTWIARVDLCWHKERVIVEYDGAVHLEEKQRRRDAVRRNELQAAGWLVITLTADDLKDPEGMVAKVRQCLQHRTPAPPTLPSGELWRG